MAEINFLCRKCGQKLVVDESGAGLTIDCPQCQTALVIPLLAAAAPAAPSPVPPPGVDARAAAAAAERLEQARASLAAAEKERDKVTAALAAREQELSAAAAASTKLRDELARVASERDAARTAGGRVAELEAQLSAAQAAERERLRLQAELKTALDQVGALGRERAAAQASLDRAKSELRQAEETLAAATQERAAQKSALDAAARQTELLQEKVRALQAAAAQAVAARERGADLEKQLAGLAAEREGAGRELAAAGAELAKAKSDAAAVLEKLTASEESVRTITEEREAGRRRLLEVEAQAGEKTSALAALSGELEQAKSQLAAASQERDRAQARLAEQDEALSHAAASSQRSQAEQEQLAAARKELEELRPRWQELQGRAEEAERGKEQVAQFQKEVAGLTKERDLARAESSRREAELAAASGQAAKFREELGALAGRLALATGERDAACGRLSEVERGLAKKIESEAGTQQALDEARQKWQQSQAELSVMLQERDRVRIQLAERDEALRAVSSSLQAAQAEVKKLTAARDELVAARSRLAELEGAVGQAELAQEQAARLRNQMQALTVERDLLREESADRAAELKESRQQVGTIQTDLQSVRQGLSAAASERDVLRQQLNDLQQNPARGATEAAPRDSAPHSDMENKHQPPGSTDSPQAGVLEPAGHNAPALPARRDMEAADARSSRWGAVLLWASCLLVIAWGAYHFRDRLGMGRATNVQAMVIDPEVASLEPIQAGAAPAVTATVPRFRNSPPGQPPVPPLAGQRLRVPPPGAAGESQDQRLIRYLGSLLVRAETYSLGAHLAPEKVELFAEVMESHVQSRVGYKESVVSLTWLLRQLRQTGALPTLLELQVQSSIETKGGFLAALGPGDAPAKGVLIGKEEKGEIYRDSADKLQIYKHNSDVDLAMGGVGVYSCRGAHSSDPSTTFSSRDVQWFNYGFLGFGIADGDKDAVQAIRINAPAFLAAQDRLDRQEAALPTGAPNALTPVRSFGEQGQIWSLALSPDGHYLAAGDDHGLVRLLDATSGNEARRFEGHTERVSSLAFLPDGIRLLSGSYDGTTRLWNVSNGEELHSQSSHLSEVSAVAVAPDGRRAISAGFDKTVFFWDLETHRELRIFLGHQALISSAAFSPNGQFAASAGGDQTVRLWDLNGGQEKRIFRGHASGVQSVAFSPDGRLLLSSSGGAGNRRGALVPGMDQTARIWDVDTGEERQRFVGHADWVLCAAFSPDGRRVLTGSGGNVEGGQVVMPGQDNSVRLWDVRTGMEIARFQGHTNVVTRVIFSLDGQYGYSASWDGTIKTWKLP